MPDEAPRKTRSQYALRALRNGRTRARNHISFGDLIAANKAQEKAAHTAEQWLTGAHPQDHVTVEGHDLSKKRKKLIKRSLLACPFDEEQAVTQS